MSQFGAPASYTVAVASSDIPNAWLPDARPRVASGGSHRILSIATQNGTVASGQSLQFQLPAGMGAGFLVGGSAYIRMTVNVTQTNAGNPAYSWYFKQTGCASSIIQRMTAILSGAQLETIQQYNKIYNSLLQHGTNGNYVANDSHLAESTYPGSEADFNGVASYTVSIPVGLGIFNAKQHIPLFLLSSAMLQCDLASVLEALVSGTANAITDFTVSNAVLIAEQICPDSAYEMGMKQMLASRVYQMSFDTWYNNKYAQATSITAPLGLNSSSVRGIFWQSIPFVGSQRSHAPTSGGQTTAQLTLDGALVSNSQLADPTEQYLEMNRALGNIFDITRTSVGPAAVPINGAVIQAQMTLAPLTRTNYAAGAYLGGLSCQRSAESGFGFVGTPVNQAVLSWSGAASTGDFYVYCALQQVLTIDQNGTCNLIR
jgi:hypothetical protein